jgi:OOP family OmpA-OmpF porin
MPLPFDLLVASGPIVYWSPAHRDYEILGVIKRNERDAVDAIRVTQKDDSFVIILNGDVLFDFDKSEIKPEAAKVLDTAAETIKSVWRNGSVVLVNGYTDNIGSEDYNNRLSERRAQAVAHWFPSRGLPYSVMKPCGFGKTNPAAPSSNQASRAKNRRVEIFVMRS